MKIIVVPARLRSSRLKEKPLYQIKGKPLIRHVLENLIKTGFKIMLAYDDNRIYESIKDLDILFVKTPSELKSGTDRVYEAIKDLKPSFIINHQGDEIFSYKEDIENLFKALEKDSMATLYTDLEESLKHDPNTVKLVLDKKSYAIYFSRALIPYDRNDIKPSYFKHIGIYGYRFNFLKRFVKLSSKLELIESLEQLRALENGYKIKCVYTKNFYHGIDTKKDIDLIKDLI